MFFGKVRYVINLHCVQSVLAHALAQTNQNAVGERTAFDIGTGVGAGAGVGAGVDV